MMSFTDMSVANVWDEAQWRYIYKNVGEWQGWFRQFSPEAMWQGNTSSSLTLEEDCPGQHMTLVLERWPEGKPPHRMSRELGYPGAAPYICFFPTGAFSQGAMQRRPWSSFGAEFSLLSGHRRMRLVQLYEGNASGDHRLDYVTLIPEYRQPMEKPATPVEQRLSVDNLLGTWRGESLYLSATMETPQVEASHWQAEKSGTELVISDHTFADRRTVNGTTTDGTDGTTCSLGQSFRAMDPHRWQAVETPLQYWLLPGNVSCTVYPQLPRDHRPRLEFCWYVSPHERQRIVRDYDDYGNWAGTFLALETRE